MSTPSPAGGASLESLYELFERQRARTRSPSAPAFDPSSSPLHGKAVFLVGAPRSGTTWLHQLLALHPDVATAGEAHVFCEGVGALLTNHDSTDKHMSLGTWVSRGELVTAVRRLVDDVFTTMRDHTRPGATRVLDKTPNHVPHAAALAEVFPDAAFVHIIRDGRDVAGSAHDLWSWSDEFEAFAAAAGVWRDAITDIRAHLTPLRYLEVRYEELLADTPGGLRAVFDHLRLPADDAFLQQVVDFGRTPINVRPSKAAVSARKWADLGPDADREIAAAAGDLLVELGYLTEDERLAALRHRAPSGWRRRRPSRPTSGKGSPGASRTAAKRLLDAALAADAAAASAQLAPGAAAALPSGEHRGAAVGAALVELVAGLSVVAVEADASAASCYLRRSDGTVLLLIAHVDAKGRVERITVA